MATELEEALEGRATTRLLVGGRGVFDVRIDGERVFSKDLTHRFPEPGEMTQIVRRRVAR